VWKRGRGINDATQRRKAASDGGLHPPHEEVVTVEHHREVLPEFEPIPKIRRFDRPWNSENGRTNLARIGWQEMSNLFYTLRLDQKQKTTWHLTTWSDFANGTWACG
jgi:hypothetical protein